MSKKMRNLIKLFGVTFIALLICVFISFQTTKLHDVSVLKQHFENQQEFSAWYSTLNQSDKNLVLAGAVVLGYPDFVKTALQSGGDIKTQIINISIDGGWGLEDYTASKKINNISHTGTINPSYIYTDKRLSIMQYLKLYMTTLSKNYELYTNPDEKPEPCFCSAEWKKKYFTWQAFEPHSLLYYAILDIQHNAYFEYDTPFSNIPYILLKYNAQLKNDKEKEQIWLETISSRNSEALIFLLKLGIEKQQLRKMLNEQNVIFDDDFAKIVQDYLEKDIILDISDFNSNLLEKFGKNGIKSFHDK